MDANYLGFSSFFVQPRGHLIHKITLQQVPRHAHNLGYICSAERDKPVCDAQNYLWGMEWGTQIWLSTRLLYKIEILLLVLYWFQIHIKCYIITDVHHTTNVFVFSHFYLLVLVLKFISTTDATQLYVYLTTLVLVCIFTLPFHTVRKWREVVLSWKSSWGALPT